VSAAVHLRVDVRPVVDLAEAWRRAPELAEHELTAATWEALLLLQREIKERTPVGATSTARESIHARPPEVLADRILGVVGSPLEHVAPLETGTRPHYPPIEPLMDWVRAVLDVGDVHERFAVARAIQRKIGHHGTEGAHMFEQGLEENAGQIRAIYRAAAQRVGRRLGTLR
jgi:hypothetical protein